MLGNVYVNRLINEFPGKKSLSSFTDGELLALVNSIHNEYVKTNQPEFGFQMYLNAILGIFIPRSIDALKDKYLNKDDK
jgi:hypothetical protein